MDAVDEGVLGAAWSAPGRPPRAACVAVSRAPASERLRPTSWSLGLSVEVRWLEAGAYCDAATLPSTATPSAAPSSRVASFIAEPAPARRAGTADMIDAVIGDIASAMPGDERDDAQEDVRVRRVRRSRPRNRAARPRRSSMPNGDRAVRAEPGAEPRRERRDDDHDRRHRQEPQRGAERAVAEHELEVLGDEEHHAVHREEHEDHAAGAGAERRVAEVAHVEHRLVDAQLPQHEQREHDDGDGERGERGRARPALVGRLDEPVDERRRCR